jgi:hypothetical protein
VHIADANGNRIAKCNTNCDENSYADTYGGSFSYTYVHGNAFADANVRGGRYSWSMDAGSAGGDRSLRWLHGQRWHLCL